MSAEKAPAFQFYAADWLSDANVISINEAEEGRYIRLLSICWKEGHLPNSPEQLVKLLKGGAVLVEGWFDLVRVWFKPKHDDPSKLIHPRLEIEREKQRKWREKSSKGGKKSGVSRSKSNRTKGGSTNSQAARLTNGTNQMATLHLQSSSSNIVNTNVLTNSDLALEVKDCDDTKKRFNPPSAQDVEAYGKSIDFAVDGEAFCSYYQTRGWKLSGGVVMKDWRSAVVTWKKNNSKRAAVPQNSSYTPNVKPFGGRVDNLPQKIDAPIWRAD